MFSSQPPSFLGFSIHLCLSSLSRSSQRRGNIAAATEGDVGSERLRWCWRRTHLRSFPFFRVIIVAMLELGGEVWQQLLLAAARRGEGDANGFFRTDASLLRPSSGSWPTCLGATLERACDKLSKYLRRKIGLSRLFYPCCFLLLRSLLLPCYSPSPHLCLRRGGVHDGDAASASLALPTASASADAASPRRRPRACENGFAVASVMPLICCSSENGSTSSMPLPFDMSLCCSSENGFVVSIVSNALMGCGLMG
nr:hypothetical protein Iba_chr04bCG15270 [Ipomoea batatas]